MSVLYKSDRIGDTTERNLGVYGAYGPL